MDEETKKMLGEILATVKDLDGRVAQLEGAHAPLATGAVQNSAAPGKRLSIKEFLIQVRPTNGVQTTLAIAYYLEKYENVSTINATDIERGFRAAKEPVPSNINDKTNMCVKNGHLMEAEGKKDNMKAWVVTRSGEEVVEKGFAKEK